MKNAIRISVEKPCSEKFEDFSSTELGGFCQSCQTDVVDFTAMTDEQLVEHLHNAKEKTCGRFKASQLKTYEPMKSYKSNNSIVSRGLAVMSFSLLAICAASNLKAQDVVSNEATVQTELNVLGQTIVMGDIVFEKHTISGTVLDQDDIPLAGVNVVLKGSTEGVVTDLDGKFEFPRPLDVNDVLIFSYIGYNPQEYVVPENKNETIEITIVFDLSNISLMGAVEVKGVYSSKRSIFQKFIGLFK